MREGSKNTSLAVWYQNIVNENGWSVLFFAVIAYRDKHTIKHRSQYRLVVVHTTATAEEHWPHMTAEAAGRRGCIQEPRKPEQQFKCPTPRWA